MLDSLSVPAKERESRWLMVVLHGLGDSLAGYRWLPEAMGLPWMNYRLVNAPDHYFGGYSWYDFSGDPGPGVERSRTALEEVLADCRAQGFGPERTLMLGFSQGCLMTLETVLRHGQVLAGGVGISGYVHQLERLLGQMSPVAKEQRLLVTHGSYDSVIPMDPVRIQIRKLKEAGLSVVWREFAKEHTIAGEEEMSVIRAFVEQRRREIEASAGGGAR
jgi:phospholipase/carboxylesterase